MAGCANSTPLPRRGAIMLMGITGSGKSTFIASLTEDNSRVGKSLESCTRICEAIEYRPPGENHYHDVFLIDTPGFDDTSRSEIDILREIAGTLQVLAKHEVDLYGIIYLHRITDPRVSGASMKSLRVLERICGEDAYKNVLLVTTMWDRLEYTEEGYKIGEDREAELCEKPFWGTLKDGDAIVMRLSTGDNLSDTKRVLNARAIVKLLIQSRNPVRLLIQREMEGSRETLANTSAGMFLEENMDALQRRHQKDLIALHRELEDAAKENDRETMDLVKEDLNRSIEATERIEEQRQVLRTIRNLPRGGTPSNTSQQSLGGTTPIPQASEGIRYHRKPVHVTASFLNKEFEAVRDRYKSSVSERGRWSSGVSDPQPSNGIVLVQPPVQLESGLPKPDNNDVLKESGTWDASNEVGVGNQQLPKVVSNDVQSTGCFECCDASSSCSHWSSKTPAVAATAVPSPAPVTGKSASEKFGITAGIVEEKTRFFGFSRSRERKSTKGKSSASRESYQPSEMALGAARAVMPSKVTGAT